MAIAAALISQAAGEDLALLIAGIFAVAALLALIGYPLIFETLNGGRTPGKVAFGLRVVMADGGSLSFTAAAIRNVLRLIDFLPWFYAVGVVSVLVTSRRTRLGDLAAGTIVVRDPAKAGPPVPTVARPEGSPWDVTAVRSEEIVAIRQLLARRASLLPDRREQLFGKLAGLLRPRVGTSGEVTTDEEFLRRVLGWKSSQ